MFRNTTSLLTLLSSSLLSSSLQRLEKNSTTTAKATSEISPKMNAAKGSAELEESEHDHQHQERQSSIGSGQKRTVPTQEKKTPPSVSNKKKAKTTNAPSVEAHISPAVNRQEQDDDDDKQDDSSAAVATSEEQTAEATGPIVQKFGKDIEPSVSSSNNSKRLQEPTARSNDNDSNSEDGKKDTFSIGECDVSVAVLRQILLYLMTDGKSRKEIPRFAESLIKEHNLKLSIDCMKGLIRETKGKTDDFMKELKETFDKELGKIEEKFKTAEVKAITESEGKLERRTNRNEGHHQEKQRKLGEKHEKQRKEEDAAAAEAEARGMEEMQQPKKPKKQEGPERRRNNDATELDDDHIENMLQDTSDIMLEHAPHPADWPAPLGGGASGIGQQYRLMEDRLILDHLSFEELLLRPTLGDDGQLHPELLQLWRDNLHYLDGKPNPYPQRSTDDEEDEDDDEEDEEEKAEDDVEVARGGGEDDGPRDSLLPGKKSTNEDEEVA